MSKLTRDGLKYSKFLENAMKLSDILDKRFMGKIVAEKPLGEFPLNLYKPPVYKSRLTINTNFTIDFISEMPNAWWRFWQWLLLGWKWEGK